MNIINKLLLIVAMFSTACTNQETPSTTTVMVDIGSCIEIGDTTERNECELQMIEDACVSAVWDSCNGDKDCALIRLLRCPVPRPTKCPRK